MKISCVRSLSIVSNESKQDIDSHNDNNKNDNDDEHSNNNDDDNNDNNNKYHLNNDENDGKKLIDDTDGKIDERNELFLFEIYYHHVN